jgi:ribosome-associated protein
MAREDVAAIRAALAGELQPHADEVAVLHEAERWREKLLSDDESQLAVFLERPAECDRTRLRQLVRNAKKERDLGKPPKSARQLFRFLKELLDQQD